MQDRRKNDFVSPTLNTIEAKRIKLVQNFGRSKQNEGSLKTSQDRIENEENYSEVYDG